ncbi:S8 family serine peptidase [Gemmobacter denitrificans]|uniref:S8 family serine peptidase n=1 Tax=Gemmobacter denitrificans TaxID=3123040 RepID=A0ABU8BV20_9RHOB
MNAARRIILALLLALTAGLAQAADCVRPGDIIDVPSRGFPAGEGPQITLDHGGVSIRLEPLAVTASRVRLRLPLVGLPWGTEIRIRQHGRNGKPKTLAVRVICQNDGKPGAGADALARKRRVPLERATANDVAAPSGAPEYLLAGSADQAGKAEALLQAEGATILRRKSLPGLRLSMLAVDLNGQMTLGQLRSALGRRDIKVSSGRHAVYRAAAGPTAWAPQMVGQNPVAPCRLGSSIRIGLIDGPVDPGQPALAGVPIRSTSVLQTEERQGSPDHATGIAALIAAPGGGDLPPGIAPGAQLYSVVAFARAGGREVARLENIASALDWLIQSRVRIINMSIAGPENDTLAEIIRIADAAGIVMLAAAGNGGKPGVAYPASDPRVIGVTAVDADRKLYRKANTGPEVAFAAPGVDLLVPKGQGTAYRSGTSYATAIATAIAAQAMARGASGRDGVIAALRAGAEDLGPAGQDSQFGWGLIRLPGGC